MVDSLQHGFRAIVPPECVGDRSAKQHAANLIDIDGKYGDVVDLADVIAALDARRGITLDEPPPFPAESTTSTSSCAIWTRRRTAIDEFSGLNPCPARACPAVGSISFGFASARPG